MNKNNTTQKILVIDAQGGGLGKQLIQNIRKDLPQVYIMAVGTNSAATSAMRWSSSKT